MRSKVQVKEASKAAALRLLSPAEWAYLASLLAPLLVLSLILSFLRAAALETGSGAWASLLSVRSEVLFNSGYALLCVGLFAVLRRGLKRRLLTVVFRVLTLLLILLSAGSYLYLQSTGSTLDYGIASYYVGSPGEAQGAVMSEAPTLVWPLLGLLALYSALAPILAYKATQRRAARRASQDERASSEYSGSPEHVPAASPEAGRRVSRRRFLASAGGAGAGVALLGSSVFSEKLASGSTPAPVPNLVAGKLQKNSMEAAASSVEVSNPLAGAVLRPTARTRPRHVALIHLESVRSRSVSPYNMMSSTTPYLEELASRSLLIDRSYSTLPHTSKALVSVNAGLYPHPATEILEAEPGALPAPALARLLGDRGYRTAWFQSAIGSFEDRPSLVENFGYQHFEAVETMQTEGFDEANYLGYEDDVMLEPSLRWLQQNAASPTFVKYLGVTPHHDYRVPDRYGRESLASKEMLDRYLNNVRYDDFWVSNIIEQYERLGLYEDTIFVIYGDHGEGFGEHGRYQHDGVIWEEGLRAPLMVHAPGLLGAGRLPGPANLMDIPPTIVKLLGYEVEGGDYPGIPVTDLGGRRAAERTLYANCRPDLLSAARIKGHEKYIYHYDNRPDELYDLRRDPLEQNNLVTEDEPREDLQAEVLDWRAKTAALYEQA